MGPRDEVVEIDSLERGLLSDTSHREVDEDEDEPVLYSASFKEMEDKFLKYHTVQWVTKPVPFPCFGVLKKEKHILLPLEADVVIQQGYLQSLFGVYSLRIENHGIRRPPSDGFHIQGIANPSAFRKAVLIRLSNMRAEAFSKEVTTIKDVPNLRMPMSPPKSLRQDSFFHSGELLLQKLEEVESSVKRVETLIEEHHPQIQDPVD